MAKWSMICAGIGAGIGVVLTCTGVGAEIGAPVTAVCGAALSAGGNFKDAKDAKGVADAQEDLKVHTDQLQTAHTNLQKNAPSYGASALTVPPAGTGGDGTGVGSTT